MRTANRVLIWGFMLFLAFVLFLLVDSALRWGILS